MRKLLLAASVALCPLTVGVERARADATEGETLRARALFESGAKHAAAGRWRDALPMFEQSWRVRAHATTSYNIGYCERALGHATRARKALRRALAEDDARTGELSAGLRAVARGYLDELKGKIAIVQLTIEPPDALLTIDGRPLEKDHVEEAWTAGTRDSGAGEKPPAPTFVLHVDVGAHDVVLSHADGREKLIHQTFVAGSKEALRIELPKKAPLPAAPVNDAAPAGHGRATAGIVIGGAGLIGLGLGTYFGLSAKSKMDDAKAACPERPDCIGDTAYNLSSDARHQANISTIAFVAGGVALASGVVLYLTAPSAREKPAVSASVDPRGGGWITLSGAF